MNDDLEMIELYLPCTDVVKDFNSKKNDEKLKIIELGIALFNSGKDIIQYWNNDEWESKIKSLESTLKTKETEYMSERQTIINKIRKEEEEKYTSKIENLTSYIEDLEKRQKESVQQLQTIHHSIDEKYEQRTIERIKSEQDRYESRITDMQQKLDSSREQYENLLGRTNNSTFKGQDGESMIDKQLNLMFPKAEIEDTSQQPGRGDFILKEGDFLLMLENKNYSKNVQKSEIDKFYRDLERESNNDIQCAIFVSMNSGICNREDFSFEVINKKPILFIHRLRENMVSLKLAVNFFKNILSMKDLDLSKKEVECAFKNSISGIKRNFSKQKSRLDKFHNEQVDGLTQLESSVIDLYKLIGMKY